LRRRCPLLLGLSLYSELFGSLRLSSNSAAV
jgi:hypothetical protein